VDSLVGHPLDFSLRRAKHGSFATGTFDYRCATDKGSLRDPLDFSLRRAKHGSFAAGTFDYRCATDKGSLRDPLDFKFLVLAYLYHENTIDDNKIHHYHVHLVGILDYTLPPSAFHN